jgi:hypothetical protein
MAAIRPFRHLIAYPRCCARSAGRGGRARQLVSHRHRWRVRARDPRTVSRPVSPGRLASLRAWGALIRSSCKSTQIRYATEFVYPTRPTPDSTCAPLSRVSLPTVVRFRLCKRPCVRNRRKSKLLNLKRVQEWVQSSGARVTKKRPRFCEALSVAGAEFEPATSGL